MEHKLKIFKRGFIFPTVFVFTFLVIFSGYLNFPGLKLKEAYAGGNTCTSITSGTGNWSAPGSWTNCGGVAPTSADAAVIEGTATITVTASTTVAELKFGETGVAATNAILKIDSAQTLTVTGAITMVGTAGTSTQGTIQNGTGNGTITAATMQIGVAVTPSGGSHTNDLIVTVNAVTLSSDITLSSYSSSSNFNNPTLEIQAGTVSTTAVNLNANAVGNAVLLTMATGAQTGTLKLSSATPWTSAGFGITTTLNGTSSTVEYSGTNPQIRNTTYTGLKVSGSVTSATTVTVGGALTVTGTLTPSSGTITMNGSSASIVNSGTLTFNNLTFAGSSTTMPSGTITINGNILINNGASITKGSGTVIMSSSAAQTITDNNTTKQDLGNIQISVPSGGTTVNSGLDAWCNISSTVCNSSWLRRKKITFNNATLSGNLTNFPILVSLDSNNIDYSKTKSAGADIRFVDSDGVTGLNYQIEYWNSSGTSLVWVKIPTLTNSNSKYIYMYYNNTGASDNQSATSVWDSNFALVDHFSDGTTLSATDSTSNARNGTISGATATAGQVDGAANFSGTNDKVSLPADITLGSSYTLSTWFNTPFPATSGGWSTLFRGADTSGTGDHQVIVRQSDWHLGVYNNQGGLGFTDSGFVVSTLSNGWHHLTAVGSGSNTVFYVDGVSVGTASYKSTSVLTYIGNYQGGGQNWGKADELRISTNTARSADWINADYRTEAKLMNSFGPEETNSSTLDAWCNISSTACNSSWLNRTKINLINNNLSGNLTNFPVLVSLNSTNINYSKTKAAGADIRFVASDGSTALSYQIESWNTSGTSIVWVKIPTLNNNNTQYIYMYYNNAAATDNQAATSVWDSSFAAVYHVPDGTTLSTAESTSNANTGTNNGATAGSGKIGGAAAFNGSSQYISAADSNSLDTTSNLTISAWVNATDWVGVSGYSELVNKPGNYYLRNNASAGKIELMWFDGTNLMQLQSVNEPTTGTWHYVSAVVSANAISGIYIDGVLASTGSPTNTGASGRTLTIPLYIGSQNTGEYFKGSLDEMRISTAVRSADWIYSEYRTGSNNMATYGGEEHQYANNAWCNISSTVCNASWLSRQKIIFNNATSSSNLYNFPVLVTLTSSNIDYTKTQSSGQDIRFVGQDGVTALSYEIEKWNNGGTSAIWVKVPQIHNTSSDYIWMYYNNSTANDNQAATGVWSSYTSIYHLPNGVSLSATDSTSNANNGTISNATATTGQIGGGASFNGTNAGININHPSSYNFGSGDYAVSAWIYPTVIDNSTRMMIVAKDSDTSGQRQWTMEINTGASSTTRGSLAFATMVTDSTFVVKRTAVDTFTANNWYHVFAQRKGNTTEIYVNGVLQSLTDAGNLSYPQTMQTGTADAYIGRRVYSTAIDYFHGNIDEVRIASSSFSADWVKAEYLNDTGTFTSFGGEEGASVGVNMATSVKLTSLTIDSTKYFNFNGPNTLTLTGNGSSVLVMNGTLNVSTGTVDFSSGGTSGTTIPAFTYYNLTMNKASNTFTAGGTITANNLTITAGTFTAPSGNLTINGDLSNSGTFTPNSGTVILAPTNSTLTTNILGSSGISFYNLNDTTAGSTVKFQNGNTYTFSNVLTVTGSSSNPVWLRSASDGSQWTATISTTPSLSYVNVKDSACSGGITLTQGNNKIINQGNNGTCWGFYIPGGTTVIFSSSQGGGGWGGSGSSTESASGAGGAGTGNVQATATANLSSGVINTVTVNNAGSGYTSVPSVCIVASTGSGGSLTAVLSGGTVASISVNQGGSSYTGVTLSIAAPPGNGGSGCSSGGGGGQGGGSGGSP